MYIRQDYGFDTVTIEIDESNDWILVNPKEYGFYRVNYDASNWNALINQLNTDHTVRYLSIQSI